MAPGGGIVLDGGLIRQPVEGVEPGPVRKVRNQPGSEVKVGCMESCLATLHDLRPEYAQYQLESGLLTWG